MITIPHEKAMKPCPFCGSTDQMVLPPTCDRNTPYNENDRAFPIVRCLGCISDISGKDFDASCQSAIDNWNRRIPIEAGNGGDGWLPIETAPKDGTQIDLWGINLLHHAKKGERIVNVAWGPVIDWMGRERDDWQHGRGGDFQPTHWRPLPPPPSSSNEGEKQP
ncbi:Lar family restriction alleviation protein [Rhizobium sp. 11515TR]|uniref:Lar family restriction alleviation protein n=1 Tax=Rhizobium sp. 11515TR TaxID=2028343 RepID=UPI0013042717|nr:Lar family restriction alleviation protein [Rhizobium sp. 11515TR]